MFFGLQTWLAAGSLPGGLDGLDRQSYEAALATYAVLQEAASKGLEYLEQVRSERLGGRMGAWVQCVCAQRRQCGWVDDKGALRVMMAGEGVRVQLWGRGMLAGH